MRRAQEYRLAAATVAGLGLVAIALVVAASAGERAPTRRPLACGIYPSSAPVQSGTPQVASPPVGSTVAVAPRVGVVGAWASCFRPEVVTISVADVVQWQQIDYYSPVVALDNGLELGPVRHILEVRFNRPGRYSYRAKSDPNAAGTVVVEGQARSGPELEVWSEGRHRAVSQATALADGCSVTLPTGSTPSGLGDQGFQASGITFPTPGCWEITGTVGNASLAFVTYPTSSRRSRDWTSC